MMNFQQRFQKLPSPFRRHKIVKSIIRAFPSCRYTEVQFNQTGKLIGDLTDECVRQYFLDGRFEREFFDIASPLIPDGGVFFDAGANFGFCSYGLHGARRDRQMRFFLFEANPRVFECLVKSAALNPTGSFHLIHGCLLDKAGHSSIRFDMDQTGAGYFNGPDPLGVPNVVLDDFIEEQKIRSVDLLKMDIEGSEPLALKGAKASLSRGVVKAVYVEISSENLRRQGRTPEESISLLREAGFSLFWCKREDFKRFQELSESSVRIVSDRGSFMLSPLTSLPENYQTDILALHHDTPLMHRVVTCLNSSGNSGGREVSI